MAYHLKDKQAKIKAWEIMLIVSIFLVIYIGLRIPLEKYLEVEGLALYHKMILVFVVSVLAFLHAHFFHGKSIKVQIMAISLSLLLIALLNLMPY